MAYLDTQLVKSLLLQVVVVVLLIFSLHLVAYTFPCVGLLRWQQTTS